MRKLLLLALLLSGCLRAAAQQRPMYGNLTIMAPASGTVPITVKGHAGQTADLLQVETSVPALVFNVRNNGNATFTQNLTVNGIFTAGGGEQFSDLTPNAFLLIGTAGGLSTTLAATNGQLLIGSTGNPPVAATLTGTTGQIAIANAAGSITLSIPNPAQLSTLQLGQKLGKYNNATATDGQLLIGNTASGFWDTATLTGTANEIIVTNGNGSITLSTPQAIGTGSSPTFNGLVITSLTFNGQTVSKGAADSCGVGFACLRVPN